MDTQTGLSNIQLELLKVFSIDLSNEQLEEIRLLLMNYFAEKVTKDFDDMFEENGWGDEKIEEWSQEHMRTKYSN
ncbi:MAG: hypothetical protein Sapg2KO_37030 [Saprospiraceae bacterium]